MNPQKNFLILLYAEPNFLSINILEQLLSNNCYINIVSENDDDWVSKTLHIASKNKFSVLSPTNYNSDINYSYSIFCSGFNNFSKTQKELDKFLQLKNLTGVKTFIVLPNELYGILNINNPSFPETVGIIYTRDMLGPRMDLESNLSISNHFREMCTEKKFNPRVGEVFFPLFVGDAARQIVKWLFAFGPFGKETILQGEELSSNLFWQEARKSIGPIEYAPISEPYIQTPPKNIGRHIIKRRAGYILAETFKWINGLPIKKQSSKRIFKNGSIGHKIPSLGKPFTKKSKIGTLVLLGVLAFPLITLLINALIFVSLYKPLIFKDSSIAIAAFNVGKVISNTSYKESNVLKNIPLLGQLYKETGFASYTMMTISDIALRGAPVVKTGEGLLRNVLGEKPYAIDTTILDSAERLQIIYEVISKFQNTAIVSKGEGSLLASLTVKKIDIDYFKNLISQMSVLTKNLPEILGEDGARTYLVLFQNNMELRPTGGFIGSYGLITFDKGRLSDFAVSDVYSADGQLNGHVEPPAPIKDYLGEANWWFRDSNWDPDFPTSARRAEWFLDKETDKSVDGVISVDLSPVKDFLNETGSLYLSDYEMDINSENLYEKVQSEVEDNFFPGTYKKKSFLTSLARSILNEAKILSSKETGDVVKLIYKNLNSKHIQIYLHNSNAQNALAALNWDGNVSTPYCGENCVSDLVGIVEANVGVNKSNYFISRKVNIDVIVNSDSLNKKLILTLKNNANKNLGVSGRYKTYIRLLLPEESSDIKVLDIYGQDIKYLDQEVSNVRGHKEVGVLVEVIAGESRDIEFSWRQKMEEGTKNYYSYYRKQAGVDDYPISFSISAPVKILGSVPPLFLTEEGNYVYNTTLTKDLVVRFSI